MLRSPRIRKIPISHHVLSTTVHTATSRLGLRVHPSARSRIRDRVTVLRLAHCVSSYQRATRRAATPGREPRFSAARATPDADDADGRAQRSARPGSAETPLRRSPQHARPEVGQRGVLRPPCTPRESVQIDAAQHAHHVRRLPTQTTHDTHTKDARTATDVLRTRQAGWPTRACVCCGRPGATARLLATAARSP